MPSQDDPPARAVQVWRDFDDRLAELTELARGVYDDGTPVPSSLQTEAAMLLPGVMTHVRASLPRLTEAMIHAAYAESPEMGEIRAAARACLISVGALTADELNSVREDVACRRAMQRLIAAVWNDPTGPAG